MVRAVLFDAGDTLFRVRGSVGHAYATVAARHGVIVVPRDMEARFRAAFRQMPPLAFPDTPPDELPQREYAWWRQVVSRVFRGERFVDFEAFFHELFAYFADAAAWELFPDTRPALAALRARGLRLAVVSNFDGRLLSICRGLGIADTFDVIVMSARAGFAKPDACIFDVALRGLGIGPGEVLHVGDSAREDVAGAQAAGLRALLVEREGVVDRRAEPSPADRVSDLRQILDRV
jgi:putative hydrolase of the HAD superfamily